MHVVKISYLIFAGKDSKGLNQSSAQSMRHSN